jgi:RecJ-like exonuclease
MCEQRVEYECEPCFGSGTVNSVDGIPIECSECGGTGYVEEWEWVDEEEEDDDDLP